MNTNKVARILVLLAAGTLLGGAAGCKSDAGFRAERKEKAVRDFQQAKTREFLSGEILSLEDCINFALTHNLELKSATLEKEAFESMRLAEGMGILPKVEISGKLSGQHAVSGQFNSSSAVSGFTGKLDYDFNYSLLDACMAVFQTRQAHDRLLLQEKKLERLKQNITLEVSKLYFQVAALQKNIKEIQSARKAVNAYKKEASPLFRLEMIDLSRMVALSAMEESLANYEEQYENAKSRLRALLGMYPNGDLKVNASSLAAIPVLPPKVLLHELEQVALMQRPELFLSDIRSNLNRTQCTKAFFQLWPALRVYRGLQIGTVSDSWENMAWTACNLLKTPELLTRCKGGLQGADLESFRASLQGLAVMAQVRMADSGFKSSRKIYDAFSRESALLAAAAKMQKGKKDPVSVLKSVPAQKKALEIAFQQAEKARKNADKIKNDTDREKANKKIDTDWKKAHAKVAGNVRNMQNNLTIALKGETVRISSLLSAVRRDLALAQVHAAYRTCFNAMGFAAADNAALESSIDLLKKTAQGSAKEALDAIGREYAALEKARREKRMNRSLYERGAKAYVAKEHIRSVEYLKRSAERGNAEALFGLGKLYWNGQGVPRDYRMAVNCYIKAAEMGKVEAMLLAGWFYYTGGIVEKDLKLARKYYKMAADRNDERAFYWLGMIHFELKEYKQALAYYKYAGRGGDLAAMVWVGTLYRNGLAEGKADLDKAILWYSRAAAKGDPNAMNSLYMIYRGAFEGEKADEAKAAQWREKYEAALKGK